MKFSLCIYHIRIYPIRKSRDFEILSEISTNNHDLYDIIDNALRGKLKSKDKVPVINNKQLKKLLRIKYEKDDKSQPTNPIYYNSGRVLSGILQSGNYGYEEDIIDQNGDRMFTKKTDQAQMKPFFFLFDIPKDKKEAYLILQRNGNDGIFQILRQFIECEIKNIIGDEFTVIIESHCIQDLKEQNYASITEAKSLRIPEKVNSNLSYGNDLMADLFSHESGLSRTSVITAPKGGYINFSRFMNSILKHKNSKNEINSDDLPSSIDGYDIPNITVTAKVFGSEKTFKLGDTKALGSIRYLDENIEKDADGYPFYEAIRQEADRLRGQIHKEKQS